VRARDIWLLFLLLSGCAGLVSSRASLGVTASTDGFIGVAAGGELGLGWTIQPSATSAEAHGEVLSAYASAAGAATQLEAGGRVDYIGVDRGGELRVGARVGGTSTGRVAFDGAVALARAHHATSDHMSLLGFELRGGGVVGDGTTVWRGFAGVTVAMLGFGHVYDPTAHWFESGNK
jgi:hypothetical protein